MIELLTAVMLAALSVNKLEGELSGNSYPLGTLAEALELEIAKGDDSRKTAIEALEGALCDALVAEILRLDANADPHDTVAELTAQLAAVHATLAELKELADAEQEPTQAGYRVAKGKAILTSAGIKSGGDEVTEKMVTGGANKLKLLKEKGHLV